MAEDAARELPKLSLEEALAARPPVRRARLAQASEPAARRWLVRYLTEGTPGLRDVATVAARLAKRVE